MLYLVLVSGLVDSFNPCAVGVLIFYLALLASLKVERKLYIYFGVYYILATYTTYLLIGFGLLRVMHLFGVHNFFGWAAAILILILALFNLKEFFFPNFHIPILSAFFNRCRLPKYSPQVTIASAITLGFLIAICEFPCSGSIYLATVSLLAARETFLRGVIYLLVYNVMFILPLIALFGVSSNKLVFEKIKTLNSSSSKWVKLGMGLLMGLSGILLLLWLLKPIV